ncbi:MAG: hypothetical protein U0R18_08045 [Mycobacterium sp.]
MSLVDSTRSVAAHWAPQHGGVGEDSCVAAALPERSRCGGPQNVEAVAVFGLVDLPAGDLGRQHLLG